MIGIIEEWLYTQIGINLNLKHISETNLFRDGCILFDIFNKYGLLDANFGIVIKATDEDVQCKKNLRTFKPLFQMLNIKYDEDVISDILKNKHSTTLKLLYEIYIYLENKNNLYFITKQSYNKALEDLSRKLEIRNVTISPVDESCHTLNGSKECLVEPIIQNKDIIDWYKRKYEHIQHNLLNKNKKTKLVYIQSEEESKSLFKPSKNHSTCSCCDSKSTNCTPLPDIETFFKTQSDNNILDYDQFILSFKAKRQKAAIKKRFEKSIQNCLLDKTWNKITENQNQFYNTLFEEYMLKQSQYEKQLLRKLIQTQEQVRLQNENQIEACNKLLNEEETQICVDYKVKEELEAFNKAYEDERKRVLELHKKLYKAKQDLIKKKRFNLCLDTVNDLVDIAMTASDYKSIYGVSVPHKLWKDWMQLFQKSQSIHIPFVDFEYNVILGDDINYDEVIEFERELDYILDENDVNEYIFTCGQWFFQSSILEHEYIDENALAFIVHRLLYKKYPLPEAPLPADVQKFSITGILLGLHNVNDIETVKTLLSKSRIHLFDTDTAIKKSISIFQSETIPPVEKKQKNQSKNIKSAKSEKEKRKKSNTSAKVSKKPPKGKTSDEKKEMHDPNIQNLDAGVTSVPLIDKETQTSLIEDERELKSIRTPLGLIGEQVYNVLQSGEKISDDLLVSVIIEYIKTLEEIEGWILLNYPLTIDQASVIELRFTGKNPPVTMYISNENRPFEEAELDEFIDKRKSKLYSCPDGLVDNSPFKTYFSYCIQIKENTGIFNESSKVKLQENEDEDSIIIDDSALIDQLVNSLEQFYKDQNIFQEFDFHVLDLTNLKRLTRMLLKQDGPDGLGSVDLFGDLRKLSKDKKKHKKSIGSEKKKTVAGKKTPTNKDANKESVTLNTDIPTVEDVDFVNLPDSEQKEPDPGDEGWKNVVLPINEDLAVILATAWENIECFYLENLKEIFFEIRVVYLRLVPYTSFVREKVEYVCNKPDMTQSIVSIFQEYYNNIDNDMRFFSEVKSQLHCKVLELQQKLWEIADDRKNEVEEKRRTLIQDNWLVNELCILINNYLSLVQVEYNRSLETMKLANDYYICMLDKNLTTNTNLLGTQVTKVTKDLFLEILDYENRYSVSVYTDIEDQSQKSQPLQTRTNFIEKGLIQCYEESIDLTLLNKYLSNEIDQAAKSLAHILEGFTSSITIESNLLAATNKKTAKEKTAPSLKSKKSKSLNANVPMKKDIIEKEPLVDNKELLIKEWAFVINNEYKRFNFRMDLITNRATEDLLEFYAYVESVFCELHNLNLTRYNNAISNIESLCSYFRTAIEEESQLTQPVIFENNSFYVNLFDDYGENRATNIKHLEECLNDYRFTINQLNKLRLVFSISGPSGVIRRQPLIYILLDLMLFNTTNNQPHLPKIWTALNEQQLGKLFDIMFGQEYVIDWRDFLIYNLEMAYPSVEEILAVRSQFNKYDDKNLEMVTKDVYENTTLWFEKDLPDCPEDALRVALIKELLFELFKTDDDKVSYTALLLYFCKDFDPATGLRKALSLSLGKNVITSKNELEEILKDEAEVKETIGNLLLEMINTIIQGREGVLIYEVFGSTVVYINTHNSEESWKTSESILSNSTEELQEDGSTKTLFSEEINQELVKESVYSMTPNQEDSSTNKWWISKIPIDLIISLLNAVYHKQDTTYCLRNMYIKYLQGNADNKGMIEAHVLVDLSCIKHILDMTKKFTISRPSEILKNELEFTTVPQN